MGMSRARPATEASGSHHFTGGQDSRILSSWGKVSWHILICPDVTFFPAFWYWTFDLMWPARKSLQSTEAPGSPLPWRFSAAFVKTSDIWPPTVPRVADRSARTHLRWWLQALSMGKWLGLRAEQLWLTPQAAGKWLLCLSCDVECTALETLWVSVGIWTPVNILFPPLISHDETQSRCSKGIDDLLSDPYGPR